MTGYLPVPEFDGFAELSGVILNGVANENARSRCGVEYQDRQGGLQLAYRKLVRRAPDENSVLAVLEETMRQYNGAHGALRSQERFLDHHIYHVSVLPEDIKNALDDDETPRWMFDIPSTGLEADLHLLFPPAALDYRGDLIGRVRLFESCAVPRPLVINRLQPVELAIRRYSKAYPPYFG